MMGRRPGALIEDEFAEDEHDDINIQIRQERMRMMREGQFDGNGGGDSDGDIDKYLDFEDVRGPLS